MLNLLIGGGRSRFDRGIADWTFFSIYRLSLILRALKSFNRNVLGPSITPACIPWQRLPKGKYCHQGRLFFPFFLSSLSLSLFLSFSLSFFLSFFYLGLYIFFFIICAVAAAAALPLCPRSNSWNKVRPEQEPREGAREMMHFFVVGEQRPCSLPLRSLE